VPRGDNKRLHMVDLLCISVRTIQSMRNQTTTKQLHGFHLVHIASAAALKLLLFGQRHTTVLPPDAKAHKRDNYHCDCHTHHKRDINTIVGGRGYIPLNV